MLYDAAHTCTFIIAKGTDYTVSEVSPEDIGLICYGSESDAESIVLKKALTKLEKAEDRVDLMYKSKADTDEALAVLLRTLRNNNYNIARLSELKAAE